MSPVIKKVEPTRICSIMWTPCFNTIGKVAVRVNVGRIAGGQSDSRVATSVSDWGRRCHLINEDFACAPIVLIYDLKVDQLLNLATQVCSGDVLIMDYS